MRRETREEVEGRGEGEEKREESEGTEMVLLGRRHGVEQCLRTLSGPLMVALLGPSKPLGGALSPARLHGACFLCSRTPARPIWLQTLWLGTTIR
jgi:hypothetical protein